jgi:hypothetical protein
MELELHVAYFFEKIKNNIWKIQKIQNKKSWDRQLWDLLVCKKSILNSLYFGLSKNDKSAKISNFQNVHCSLDLDLCICNFCWA